MGFDIRKYRGHDFLPGEKAMARIPAIYGTEGTPVEEKQVHLHFLIPNAMQAFDWWVMEYDSVERLAFGFTCLNGDTANAEFGYISLDELENLVTWMTMPPTVVVRDLEFVPKPWESVRTEWKRLST